MNKTQLAKRRGVTSQSLAELEGAELRGAITLNRLRKAAAALDCDLVYALVPKKPLETLVSEQALRRAPPGHPFIGRGWARILTELAPERAEEPLAPGPGP